MEAATPPAPQAQFTITAQRHEQYYDDQGVSQSRWNIEFQTPSGVKSFVEVPDRDYNAENVAQLINERVATIEQVQSLGQGG